MVVAATPPIAMYSRKPCRLWLSYWDWRFVLRTIRPIAQNTTRLFPHITRACQGVVFHSVDIAKQFMEKARTSTGLKVTVDILAGVYETGKKCATDFLKNMRIVFDENLPRWNYRALPQSR